MPAWQASRLLMIGVSAALDDSLVIPTESDRIAAGMGRSEAGA
jgi:hypothetical protein